MDKIWLAYGDGKQKVQALSDISLTITKGEFVAVTGPSGSGKSTLLHIMGCLMRPSSGFYLLLGKETSLLPKNTLAGIRKALSSRASAPAFSMLSAYSIHAPSDIQLMLAITGMHHHTRFKP